MLKQICKILFSETKTIPNGASNDYFTEDLSLTAKLIYENLFSAHGKPESQSDRSQDEEIKRLLEIRTNQSTEIPITNDDIWIFGYGSLVWKADFNFIDRRCGFITGFQRYFFQHSIDHRGVPSKPGRVVTLVPTNKPEDRVYGMAYRIAASQKNEVLQHLDYREKNGYERCTLTFYEFPESTGVTFKVIMYIATAENESYAGHIWQTPLIADQIFTSAGPSGPNREYLFHLATAMRILFPGVEDKHLFDLESEVLRRIKDIEPKIISLALQQEIENILKNALKCDQQVVKTVEHVNERVELIAVKCIKELLKNCEKPGWKEVILAREYLKQQES